MEDSSHEQPDDQPETESRMNRRDMAKLLGAVTALSASMGVTFIASAATSAVESQLKLKFLKVAPNGDPAKAELLCTVDISPADQAKILAADAAVELRVVHAMQKTQRGEMQARVQPQEVTLSSQTISKATWMTFKDNGSKND